MMTLREKELEARVVYLEALVATNKKQNSSIAYQFESILTPLVEYDLGGSGMYLDDDIGDEPFNLDVDEVVEVMSEIMEDCYKDNIGDVVTDKLGSDFKDTI